MVLRSKDDSNINSKSPKIVSVLLLQAFVYSFRLVKIKSQAVLK